VPYTLYCVQFSLCNNLKFDDCCCCIVNCCSVNEFYCFVVAIRGSRRERSCSKWECPWYNQKLLIDPHLIWSPSWHDSQGKRKFSLPARPQRSNLSLFTSLTTARRFSFYFWQTFRASNDDCSEMSNFVPSRFIRKRI